MLNNENTAISFYSIFNLERFPMNILISYISFLLHSNASIIF